MADFKIRHFTFISTSDNSCVIRHIQNHIVDIMYCLYHFVFSVSSISPQAPVSSPIACFGLLMQPKVLYLCNPGEQTNHLVTIAFAVLYNEKACKAEQIQQPYHLLLLKKDIRFAVQESFFQESFSFLYIRLLSVENTVKIK